MNVGMPVRFTECEPGLSLCNVSGYRKSVTLTQLCTVVLWAWLSCSLTAPAVEFLNFTQCKCLQFYLSVVILLIISSSKNYVISRCKWINQLEIIKTWLLISFPFPLYLNCVQTLKIFQIFSKLTWTDMVLKQTSGYKLSSTITNFITLSHFTFNFDTYTKFSQYQFQPISD